MAKKLSSDKKKQIAVAGLFGVIAIILVYQFFLSEPPPKPSLGGKGPAPATATKSTTVTTPEAAEKVAKRQPSDKQMEQAEIDEMLQNVLPLDLSIVKASGPAVIGTRGNIFDFYKPPPPPPPQPQPLPPITVSGVSPANATAGVPRSFTLMVYGRNFPADPQIYMNGSPRATKRVNDTTLTTEMSPPDYASQGSQNVEVKSQSEPAKLFSNVANFTVSPAPEPPFRFIGVLGEMALVELTSSKDIIRVPKGGSIQNVWHVDAISLQAMDVTNTQLDIKRRVNMQPNPGR